MANPNVLHSTIHTDLHPREMEVLQYQAILATISLTLGMICFRNIA